jgi:hypothetical protein
LLPASPAFAATIAHPRGRPIPRRTFGIALACLLLAVASPARAWDWTWDETQPGLRLSLGVDVFRVPGNVVATARYGGSWNVKLGTWASDARVEPRSPRLLAGAGYVLTKAKWRLGAGLVWIDEENNVNGTRWNFDVSIAYDLSDRLFFEYQHYSHGKIFGLGTQDASNGGWNLVSMGYIF